MAIEREAKPAADADISREGKAAGTFKRSERLSMKFGGGKFGVGKFSKKKITREKNV